VGARYKEERCRIGGIRDVRGGGEVSFGAQASSGRRRTSSARWLVFEPDALMEQRNALPVTGKSPKKNAKVC